MILRVNTITLDKSFLSFNLKVTTQFIRKLLFCDYVIFIC